MTFATQHHPHHHPHSHHHPSKPPTKKLFQHIKRREWADARIRTLIYPWDAHFRRPNNNVTPMHMVCLYRAPIDVVEILLDANPSALLVQDSEGWTPIHLVLLYGAQEDVALLLIKRGGASAASILTGSPIAGSPLHVACRHHVSLKVLEELINANTSMAITPDETGAKPAEVLWNRFTRKRRRNPSSINNNQSLMIGTTTTSSTFSTSSAAASANQQHPSPSPPLNDLFQRYALLLHAAKKKMMKKQRGIGIGGLKAFSASSSRCYDDNDNTNNDSMELLMHELLTYQVELGDMTGFLEVFLQYYPEQVHIPDHNGNYLLHIASASQLQQQQEKDSICILVESFPDAARFVNKFGDLPLHLAIREGNRTWTTSTTTTTTAATARGNNKNALSILIEAFPDALCIRDRKTKLYPFQLAAATAACSDSASRGTATCTTTTASDDDDDDLKRLGTIFELLLAAPHVLFNS